MAEDPSVEVGTHEEEMVEMEGVTVSVSHAERTSNLKSLDGVLQLLKTMF